MDESDLRRETFTRYGRSMYFAQVLEHGLVNTIVIARIAAIEPPSARSREEWEGFVAGLFDVHFERTMGQLLSTLKGAAEVPADLESVLFEALYVRNFLAHSFFRQRAGAILSVRGRQEMIEELDGYTDIFRRADGLLEDTLRPIREPLGITDEALAAELRSMYPAGDRDWEA